MWKWMFRLSALPKRWINVTAPVRAVVQENPAFLIRCVAIQRYTMPSSGEILDDVEVYELREFCEVCGVQTEHVVEMVESGVIEVQGVVPSKWRFSARTVLRFRRALRLQLDLEINLPGVALSLDLIDDLETLRNEVRSLQHQLAKIRRD